MREPEVEVQVRRYLANEGYVVLPYADRVGPDIIATKDGKKLLVEVKGDRPGHRSSPATVNVDVLTLLGQIVLRKGQLLADEYAIAIRPTHRRLIDKAAPVLLDLSVKVLLVSDTDVRRIH